MRDPCAVTRHVLGASGPDVAERSQLSDSRKTVLKLEGDKEALSSTSSVPLLRGTTTWGTYLGRCGMQHENPTSAGDSGLTGGSRTLRSTLHLSFRVTSKGPWRGVSGSTMISSISLKWPTCTTLPVTRHDRPSLSTASRPTSVAFAVQWRLSGCLKS